MSTRCVLILCIVTSLILNCINSEGISPPPNIILVVADDLGYADLGFKNGQQVSSPNIDELILNGQFLKWHYSMSVCSPTRSTLMTGKYTLHTGINGVIPGQDAYGLPINDTLLPQVLKLKANYTTHMIGKWHLGFYKTEYTPTFRGFDSFYGYYNGGEDYYTHFAADPGTNNPQGYDFRFDNKSYCGMNCSKVLVNASNIYSTYLFTERAINIIDQHKKQESPLFLYLAYQNVHSPTEVPYQYQNMYINTINNTLRQKFAGMVTCMDDSFANVTAKLNEKGYLNDTG